jgi:hypothetical protein
MLLSTIGHKNRETILVDSLCLQFEYAGSYHPLNGDRHERTLNEDTLLHS